MIETESTSPLGMQVGICFTIFAVAIVVGLSGRSRSVGLPLCYLFAMIMIHWLGATIHVFPWYDTRETHFVESGFAECFAGMISFAVGAFVLTPLFFRPERLFREPISVPFNWRLPEIYLVLGLFFFIVLAPILKRLPSIGAVSVCGVYLAVIGLCLACWRDWMLGRKSRFYMWICVTGMIPLVTAVGLGFAGYGASAAIIVIAFVMAFYRPRWQTLLGAFLFLFLGFSLFVNYMRDRDELRASVWSGAGYGERMDVMFETLSRFEFLDLTNPRHLGLIDLRLNQNIIVGQAVQNLEAGNVDFARGKSILESVLAIVPRVIWPDKPVRAGGRHFVREYTGVEYAEGTSVGVGIVLELYLNFGRTGVVIGFLIIGAGLRMMDMSAAFHLHRHDWPRFMAWFLPAISLINVGGNLVEVTAAMAASAVLALYFNWFLKPQRFLLPKADGAPAPASR